MNLDSQRLDKSNNSSVRSLSSGASSRSSFTLIDSSEVNDRNKEQRAKDLITKDKKVVEEVAIKLIAIYMESNDISESLNDNIVKVIP